MLLTQEDLLDQFKRNISISYKVDIASAWASPGKALDLLTNNSFNFDLRAIIGLAGSATHPDALRQIQQRGQLKVFDKAPLFHPKVFIFYGSKGTICWIGSANLTRSGFENNSELVYQFVDSEQTVDWFDCLWGSINGNVEESISLYCKNWSPPSTPAGRARKKRYLPPGSKKALRNIDSWDSFIQGLSESNGYWEHLSDDKISVYGEYNSWINTIRIGNNAVFYSNWQNLRDSDYRVLMGIGNQDDFRGFGVLGSLKSARKVKHAFRNNEPEFLEIRNEIFERLRQLYDVQMEDFPARAREFVKHFASYQGFGGGSATRLLALARPDLAVSVNRASRNGLASYAGMSPSTLVTGSPDRQGRTYERLLRILGEKQWYSSPQPETNFERALADSRAALFDAIVYNPKDKIV